MITIKRMPKETLAELILFISENENFSSVSKNLHGSFTVAEVRAALRELASEIAREAGNEHIAHGPHAESELSSKAKEIITLLPKSESQRLLAAFGLKSS